MDCYEPPIHGNEPPIHGTEPPSIDLSRHYSPHQVMKAPIRRFTRNFLIQVSSAPRDAVLQSRTILAGQFLWDLGWNPKIIPTYHQNNCSIFSEHHNPHNTQT
ncbi:hypothetical protein MJO29_003343 [Puccinia striiformis f. sp. tritici]|nr:hypothetical protein MJO29_003343 [Puccinia striiformis f. sp. tritici]